MRQACSLFRCHRGRWNHEVSRDDHRPRGQETDNGRTSEHNSGSCLAHIAQGISITGMKKEQIIDRLVKEEHFLAEACQAVMFFRGSGDRARIQPKFHCELNSIERV